MNTGHKMGALEREWECWKEDGNAGKRVGMLRERVTMPRRDFSAEKVGILGRGWKLWGSERSGNVREKVAVLGKG